jgi:hypothetical protein
MSPGFTITSMQDAPASTLTPLITVQTVKEATPEDPSVIQRYVMAPGATAGRDLHLEVEHLIILDGVFNDGYQDVPADSVISGEPGSEHYPSSTLGCTFLAIFPKGLGKAE